MSLTNSVLSIINTTHRLLRIQPNENANHFLPKHSWFLHVGLKLKLNQLIDTRWYFQWSSGSPWLTFHCTQGKLLLNFEWESLERSIICSQYIQLILHIQCFCALVDVANSQLSSTKFH